MWYKKLLKELGDLITPVDWARFYHLYAFYLTECVDNNLEYKVKDEIYKKRYEYAAIMLEKCHKLYEGVTLDERQTWEAYEKYSDLGKAYNLCKQREKSITVLNEVINYFSEKEKWYSIKNVYFAFRRLADTYFKMHDLNKAFDISKRIVKKLFDWDKKDLLTNKIYLARALYDIKSYFYHDYVDTHNLESLEIAKEYLAKSIAYYNSLPDSDKNKVDGLDIKYKINKSLEEEGLEKLKC